MTEIVSIKDMSNECRIMLLNELGYDSDGRFVTEKNGKMVLDRYTGELVLINNLAIFQGSTIILDNNPLSISSFLEEFGDVI